MNLTRTTTAPIHPLLENRWSPRAFSSQVPTRETLVSLFEAARWAPSSMNAQPWRFIMTTKENPKPYQALFSTLKEGNQSWAQTAPVLVLAIMKALRSNGKPDRNAPYDLGQAVAHLTIQAMSHNLYIHQMGGFNRDAAAELFNLPSDFQPMTVLAIGYLGTAADLPKDVPIRRKEDSTRNPVETIFFEDRWNDVAETS